MGANNYFTTMGKRKLYKAIYYSNGILLLLIIALCLMGIFDYPISSIWANRISLFLGCILFVIDFILYRLVKWMLKYFGHKEKCNFVSTNTCPYGSKDDCPYNVTACYAYQDITPTPKKVYSICFLLVVSIVISITAELLKDDGQLIDFMSDKYSLQTIAKMLQPIAQSVIAAIIISFIIDIPERMKEYKDFFIDILTSFDYLKNMNEEQLTNLRKRVTWQLHVKDFPHMAEGLIDLDEQFCKMLKQPYFSEYSQIVNVHACKEDKTLGNGKHPTPIFGGLKDFADDADFSSLMFVSPTDFTEFHRFLPYAGWDFADVADDADFFCSSSITHHDLLVKKRVNY